MEQFLKFKSASEAIIYFGNQLLANGFPSQFNLDDPITRSMYKKAYLAFAGGHACIDEQIDPSKGVWLIGNTGVGKSTLMRVMQRLYKDTPRRFKWVTSTKLKDLAEECGTSEIMGTYGKPLKCDLYIDDLDIADLDGRNPTSIITRILYERYDLFNQTGFKTHCSSYLSRDDKSDLHLNIEHMANCGTTDRLYSITNMMLWKGESLRKRI